MSAAEMRGGALLLLVLVALFHGASLRNGFVYDDSWTIVGNPIIRDPRNLWTLLGSAPARELVPDAGRPVLLATELLDHALFGLAPAGYHLQNLLWHAGVCVLFFLLAGKLTGSFAVSLLAAGAFSVHPLTVEPVSAVNYREDLLAAFFTLSALALVVRARGGAGRRARWGMRAAGCALLATGVFAKENTSIAPILLVIHDVCVEPDSGRAVVRRFLPDYLLLAAPILLAFGWRWTVFGAPAVVSLTAEVPPAHLEHARTLLREAWIFVRGAGQLVVPAGLSPEYAEDAEGARGLVAGGLSLAATASACAIAYRARARHPVAALGLLGGAAAYLPTSGLVAISNLRADRYFYLPAIPCLLGLSSLAMAGVRRSAWFSREAILDVPRPLLAAGGIFILLGLLTLRQGRIWRSDVALWTAATERAPGSARAFAGLAEAHLRIGRRAEALRDAERSLAIDPDSGHTHELVGVIGIEQGDLARALRELRRAQALGVVNRGELLNNLGTCEMLLRRYDSALGDFAVAARLSPRLDRPLLNAARVYEAQGRAAEAAATLRELVRRIPESFDGWSELGRLLEEQGDHPAAAAAVRRADALRAGGASRRGN